MQSIVRDCVGPDKQLKAEHPMSEILQGKRCHSIAGLGPGLLSDTLRNAEQECAGAGRWIENRDGRIAQTLGRKIVADCSVKRANHVANDFYGCVVDAKPFAGLGSKVRRKSS